MTETQCNIFWYNIFKIASTPPQTAAEALRKQTRQSFRKRAIYSEVKLYSHVVISLKRNRSVVIRHEMDNVTGIFLRKEVEELRKQGESWGLTKDEIDQAILRALGGKVVPISL